MALREILLETFPPDQRTARPLRLDGADLGKLKKAVGAVSEAGRARDAGRRKVIIVFVVQGSIKRVGCNVGNEPSLESREVSALVNEVGGIQLGSIADRRPGRHRDLYVPQPGDVGAVTVVVLDRISTHEDIPYDAQGLPIARGGGSSHVLTGQEVQQNVLGFTKRTTFDP